MWVIDIVDYLNMDLHHDTPHTLVHIYQTHITVRCLNKDKHSNYLIMKLDHVNQPQANQHINVCDKWIYKIHAPVLFVNIFSLPLKT